MGSAELGELELARACRLEGPPGPAGGAPALPGLEPAERVQAPRAALADSVAWLMALRALDLPFDELHLRGGARGAGGQRPSPMEQQNLRAVALQPRPRRWQLLVFVLRVELVAGELEAQVCDPFGEAGASLERRAAQLWPRALREGAALLLSGVVALPGPRPRLLVVERALARAFAPGDLGPEDAGRLLREARAPR